MTCDFSALVDAIENKNKSAIKFALEDLDHVRIADFLLTAKEESRELLIKNHLRFYPEVLAYLTNDLILEVIDHIGHYEFAKIAKNLQADDIVDILEDLSNQQIAKILEFFPHDLRRIVKEILSYPEESAGRLIHKDFIVAPQTWSTERLLQFIRIQRGLPKYLNEIFIVDDLNRPVGSVALKDLLRTKGRSILRDVMDKEISIKIIKAGQDQEEVAKRFKDYNLSCAAVTDDFEKIVGIISIDDVVDVIEEKAEEGMLHAGRVSESDINADVFTTVLRRIKWLIITFFSINFSSYIIGFFDEILQKNVELAILMPVIAAMGGNAGIQASTVAVRAIVTKQLTGVNAARLFTKEMKVGLCNGIAMAILMVGIIALRFHEVKLELTFITAIMIVFTLATSVGAAIPFIVDKFGGDPALSSSIITSSFTDVLAFTTLLSVAALVFHNI